MLLSVQAIFFFWGDEGHLKRTSAQNHFVVMFKIAPFLLYPQNNLYIECVAHPNVVFVGKLSTLFMSMKFCRSLESPALCLYFHGLASAFGESFPESKLYFLGSHTGRKR